MSLRHLFPECDLPDLRTAVDPVNSPPMARRPREVEFRNGKNLDEVAAMINGYKHVQVKAAVGSGKSTGLPAALCRTMSRPILHVFPSRLMAVDNYDYVSKNPEFAVKYALALAPGDATSDTGVTVTTYACVVARLLIAHASGNKSPLGDVVVYADEVAESDCYTYVCNTLGPGIPGIVSYVKATATHDPEKMPMRETDGAVESRKYELKRWAEWDAHDEGKPWSATTFTGNVAIFVDDDIAAEKLVTRYNMGGATAFRLSAKMDISLFRRAFAAMRDPNAGIVVLVVDYSFRNGFTMDVDIIVDSGFVRYYVVDNGSLRAKYRPVYKLESYQTMGRGGRCKGQKVLCWNPDIEMKSALCVLEGVESEAAALLFRLLGYAPPPEIRDITLFAKSRNIPQDLGASLNGFVALTMLPEAAMQSFIYEKPSSDEAGAEVTATDVLSSYGDDDDDARSLKDYFAHLEDKSQVAGTDRLLDGLAFMQQLENISSAASTLMWPNYYGCHGLVLCDKPLFHYGDNWRKAYQDVLGKPGMVFGMDPTEISDMVGVFLLQYNACVMEVASANRVLTSQKTLMSLAQEMPELVKRWTGWLTDHVRDNEIVGKGLLKAISELRTPSMNFIAIPPDLDMEEEKATEFARRLAHNVQRARQKIDGKGIFSAVKQVLAAESSYPGDVNFISATAITSAGKDELSVQVKPVNHSGKKMYDIYVDAPSSIVLRKEDYVAAVEQIMDKAGLSASGVRKLVLQGSRLNSGEVMQEIKDVGLFKRRKKRRFSVKLLPPAKE